MTWRHLVALWAVVAGLGVAAAAQESAYSGPTTHAFSAHLKVRSDDGKLALQTLCADADGRVYALLAGSRYAPPAAGAVSEVHAFAPDGKPAARWRVGFTAQAINADAKGVVYVAGDGKVARFDHDGKPLGPVVELPHVAELFKDKDALRRRAEEQQKLEAEQVAASMKQMRQQYEKLIGDLEAKPAERRTAAESRRLEQYRQILKSYETFGAERRGRSVDAMVAQMQSRARMITSIAATERDVFVVGGEAGGWGYGAWRMDRDLANPKRVLKDLSGCCGQMDLQAQGDDILLAENTRHQFTRYDRDGKPLGQYGKRDATDPAGFGGCCNPMNLRCRGQDVYTAESEGLIKRFTSDGRFVEVVGSVQLSGGCKHVALATSPDASKVYFCDLPGSQIVVLARKVPGKPEK